MLKSNTKPDPTSPNTQAYKHITQERLLAGTMDHFKNCLRQLNLKPTEFRNWTEAEKDLIAKKVNEAVMRQSDEELRNHEENKGGFTY